MSILRAWLGELREDRRARWFAVATAVAIGLAVAQIHWYGFVLGGALVGLVSKDTKRALLAGLAFGILAWVVFAGVLASNGALLKYVEMGQVLGVSAAIPVVAAGLGSLVRGVV
ncbi:hypothetical protein [Halorussus amylolyticus]|uniref:hypothetical protein n=1 Tax=Halorussus amylolyticus TaxID=1126242 RepID=UPI0010490B5E|nr:hypothetical protein [Halorussus amylolyticus]